LPLDEGPEASETRDGERQQPNRRRTSRVYVVLQGPKADDCIRTGKAAARKLCRHRGAVGNTYARTIRIVSRGWCNCTVRNEQKALANFHVQDLPKKVVLEA
jgi:hypothetical protein